MASTDQIHLIFSIFLYISTLAIAADSPPSPPPMLAGGCSDQVVAFSPCLQYISLPPNNLTPTPSSACCAVYSAAFSNGSAACLCYLVRGPLLLGFPLSTPRILSLSSLCPLPSGGSAANTSLDSFCSGSSALPPLQAIIGPEILRRRRPRPSHESPPPPPSTTISPPGTGFNLSIVTPTSSSHQSAHTGSATENISSGFSVSLGLMISFLVPISTSQIDTPLYILFVNQVAYGLTRIK